VFSAPKSPNPKKAASSPEVTPTRLAAPRLGTTRAATMSIAIQKMPECPESCSGRRRAILAITTSAANNASRIN